MSYRIANKDMRGYVMSLTKFRGSNTFAEKRPNNLYVVFSYGYHWPMFICKDGQWYENSGRYSVSTSKHHSQARPWDVVCEKKTCEEMRAML